FLKKCAIFFLITVPVFAQNTDIERDQALYTGTPSWRQALGGAVLSLPSVQAQSAVVALDGGNIRAYSTAGTPMWNYSARGRISPFVTRSREGTSYFSRTNGTLIAVNRAGRELWRRSLESPICAKVICGWDGRLFVPVAEKIFCYTASGNLLWTRDYEAPISLAPKLDHSGGIIFALENNHVYRISAFGDIRTWTLFDPPAALIPVERQQQILVLYKDGSMSILGQSEDWFFSAQGEVHPTLLPKLPGRPIAAAGRKNNIAVVFDDGSAALFSLEPPSSQPPDSLSDGNGILWKSDSHIKEFSKNGGKPEPEAEIVYDDRGIYILSKNGATGFTHNGERIWFMFLQNTAAIPAFGNDGVLYSGGKDWILYAYKIEARVLPERKGLFGPLPEGSYGTGSPNAASLQNFPLNEYEFMVKLEQIKSGINSGRVGTDEIEWVSTLMKIAEGKFNIRHKLDALHLLGRIGSFETVPWLVNFFRRELDPLVRAAAAKAIGDIGVDHDGVAIQTFLFLLINGGGIKDEQVLLAIASATGALCRFSGPPLSESGIKILNLLTAGNQAPIVRRQAQNELSSLK
ncbi:MAG: PQQ-binding-like beta-propeller repeat protein, partial [Treponema sp.]|nr:PQQ-binding-like beta-propeller repeat protein [Treponema sp.]